MRPPQADGYILTLRSREEPTVLALCEGLSREGLTPRIVPGIHGAQIAAGEYFSKAAATRNKLGYWMSPGEVGCALGHRLILERIVASQAPLAFVFEDDVELAALGSRVPKVIDVLTTFGLDFVHIGKMGSHLLSGNLYGKRVDPRDPIFEIEVDSLGSLYGTFGYVISRRAAEGVLQGSGECLFKIDDFPVLRSFIPQGKVFYWPLVEHPTDPSASSIEAERERLRQSRLPTPLFKRLMLEVCSTWKFRRRLTAQKHRRKRGDYVDLRRLGE